MADYEERREPGAQASEDSVVVGSLRVEGPVDGSLIIGSHNVVGFTSDQVSTLITQISTTFQPKPFDGRSPYKGLDVFEEEDAELFFGREKSVDDLVNRVKDSRTVFVTGPSGSGKSSLVRAGLIHALRQGALKHTHSEDWLYATMKPGRNPNDALANALSRLKSPELGNYFRQHANEVKVLEECAESALTDRHDQRLVLFIDQFEEVFTQIDSDETRTILLDLLTHAATVEHGRVILLFAMRSDFVPNCATYPQLNSLLNQQFVQIGAMQPDELVSAIAQPALRVGLQIDPDLVSQIINDMKGEPGALPLMQFALEDLFNSEQMQDGVIALRRNDYLQRGGIQKSLERHADKAFAELDEHEQELARTIFSGLIEVGQGNVDTRRTALSNELIPAGIRTRDVNNVVQKLASARLITTDKVTVTISHEKLIDAWPWLKKLVNENRDVIALQNEIAKDAKDWAAHNRDASYLYTGARLANTREKLEDKKLTLGGLAQSFIDVGIQIEESKHQDEEKRRQKELEDAHQLAETALARAQAERRGRLVTIGMLISALILAGVLGYRPVLNESLRQQAMTPDRPVVEAGNYFLGDEQRQLDAPDDYLPYKEYPISGFSIDVDPVTNERYGYCIRAGVCPRPNALRAGYEGVKNGNKPVVNVTAIDAAQFCNWLGMRLPSEKEWELAVRQKILNSIDPNVLTDAVNFYEWTSSSYDQKESDWKDIAIDPPAVLTLRGGQLNVNEPFKAYQTKRERALSTYSANIIGFRCVMDQ